MQGVILLGEYEVQRHIGGGGMAQVYLAHARSSGDKVAVKIMNTEHVRKTKSVERFKREARLICRLRHPNLVRGISTGLHDGRPLIIMEYVDGPSIAELIEKRGRLSPDESLKLLLDVTLALNHLFIEGTIQAHRDIKPHNILVAPGGIAKLTDFGIARAFDDAEAMTLTSSFLGSPHYMSPEQITDPRAVDIRSDIYALGAVFYEMLTGEKAFPGQGTKEILDAHFDLEPPTLAGSGELVESCNEILQKTMAYEPIERYQTPAELVGHLNPHAGSDISIAVPRFAKATVRFATFAAIVAATALLAVGFALTRGTQTDAATGAGTPPNQETSGTAQGGGTSSGGSGPRVLPGAPTDQPEGSETNPSGATGGTSVGEVKDEIFNQ